jgi:hypothetical protein
MVAPITTISEMKPFLVGLWALIVALSASYAVAMIDVPGKTGGDGAKAPTLQLEKTRVLNVPMIAGGAIRGFVVAQFNYTVDATKAKSVSVAPDVFLLDEAFRTIYTDDHLDFMHLEKYDVNGLTKHLVTATNQRLGAEVVRDVLIQDFTFISKEENER